MKSLVMAITNLERLKFFIHCFLNSWKLFFWMSILILRFNWAVNMNLMDSKFWVKAQLCHFKISKAREYSIFMSILISNFYNTFAILWNVYFNHNFCWLKICSPGYKSWRSQSDGSSRYDFNWWNRIDQIIQIIF